jgi:hypothetical protein
METTRGHLGLCLYARNLVSLRKKPCVFTQETLCLKIYHSILNGYAKEIAI